MRMVSNKITNHNVTGLLMGMYVDDIPFVVKLENTFFLPLFTTLEKLQECVKHSNAPQEIKIKQITDHAEFMSSVKGRIRLMLDPYITPEGNTRFIELITDEIFN